MPEESLHLVLTSHLSTEELKVLGSKDVKGRGFVHGVEISIQLLDDLMVVLDQGRVLPSSRFSHLYILPPVRSNPSKPYPHTSCESCVFPPLKEQRNPSLMQVSHPTNLLVPCDS